MKRNKFVLMSLIVLFSVNFISAVSLFPSSIDINTYPGETHLFNFTVNSDGIYVLFFNSSNQFITISPPELIVHNGDNITLNFTFSPSVSTGLINFEMYPSTNAIEVIPSSASDGSSGSSGRTRIIYKDRNNTIYVPVTDDTPEKSKDSSITGKSIFGSNGQISPLAYTISILVLVGIFCVIHLLRKGKNMPKGSERRFKKDEKNK